MSPDRKYMKFQNECGQLLANRSLWNRASSAARARSNVPWRS